MNKPHWLNRTLLVTTALMTPAIAQAQDVDSSLEPQTEAAESLPQDAEAEAGAPDVSVPGAIFVTGRRNKDQTRSSEQVVSVLSSADIARTGEGDIAGALGRVTGMSVVGNGYVYVRGLGDRYSLALLNGLPLPSPEPLKRVVPLDIFPTNVVSSSMVQKSYSANFPGEFGGGVVNLTTIAVPDESFLSVGLGVSGNTETTGHFGYSYYGSDTDWTGFDSGYRAIPSNLSAFLASGERIGDIADDNAIAAELVRANFDVVQKLGQIPANSSASLTGGTAFDVGEARVGVVATLSYSNEWQTRDITQQSAALADLSLLGVDFRTVSTQNHITVNGMLGFGVELGEHKFRLTNLFIRDTIKEARLTEGEDLYHEQSVISQATGWYERQLIDTQFVGELRFGSFGMDLRAGYANSQREAPFESSFKYVRTNQEADPLGSYFINRLDGGNFGDANVAFSDLNEDLWYGGVDFSLLLTDRISATVGYAYTDQKRSSSRREFDIRAPQDMPRVIGMFRPDYLVQPSSIEYWDFSVVEYTEADPAFDASLVIHGGYGKLNIEPLDTVKLDIGARYETADQVVAPVQVFNLALGSSAGTTLSNDYWLPAATLTWEVTPELQFRLNASKTIARPQFRELIFQLYYDPETNRQYRGNPFLVDSQLYNGEARIEYYISNEERVSLAGFYKRIDNPIETFITYGDNSSRGGFANAPRADLYGAEFELVKYVGLYDMGGWFSSRRIVAIANYTYTKSQLKVEAGDTVLVYPSSAQPALNYFKDGSPLTGQSDHIANLQFGLEDEEGLSQQTILVNYASDRVVGRGDLLLPDVIEHPGVTVDFVAREGLKLFGTETEWKFEVRNIFGTRHQEYQANDTYRIDLNTYNVGTKISLSVSAEF